MVMGMKVIERKEEKETFKKGKERKERRKHNAK